MALCIEMPPGNSSEALFDAALHAGIPISHGVMFSNSGCFDGFARLSCGLPYTREFDRAVRTWAGLVKLG
jgi:DNA-binding transcriptional MocR family regulator